MQIDCKTAWENCLLFIKGKIGDKSFKTWFEPIIPIKLENQILTIQVPSQFFYEWLEEHYVDVLRSAIVAELGRTARLEYSVVVDTGNSTGKQLTVKLPTSPSKGSNGHTPTIEKEQVTEPFILSNHLNPKYTFHNFIEGDCNRLARSAGMAVANKPGVTSFNPLMVYGGVGLGKTHLVQSIGNDIKRQYPEKVIVYVSSESFTGQFIESLKNNRIQEFTNYFAKVDILIIDDIQFLSGKEKTQEIFFHIFNHLHQSGKQIIMTSDCPPRDLKGLEERLLSRFKWGLTADLQQPDYETRIAIIEQKMQADGIAVPRSVLEYVAYSVDTNIRELEGVLISLIAHASLNRKEIDLELAKQTLKNLIHDIDTEVSIDYIQKAVSEFLHIEMEDLKGKTRKKEIVIARQIAMYLAKEYTTHSLKSIGYYFGGRDHSTVIHAIQAVNDMIDTDSRVKNNIHDIKKKLKLKVV